MAPAPARLLAITGAGDLGAAEAGEDAEVAAAASSRRRVVGKGAAALVVGGPNAGKTVVVPSPPTTEGHGRRGRRKTMSSGDVEALLRDTEALLREAVLL